MSRSRFTLGKIERDVLERKQALLGNDYTVNDCFKLGVNVLCKLNKANDFINKANDFIYGKKKTKKE